MIKRCIERQFMLFGERYHYPDGWWVDREAEIGRYHLCRAASPRSERHGCYETLQAAVERMEEM